MSRMTTQPQPGAPRPIQVRLSYTYYFHSE